MGYIFKLNIYIYCFPEYTLSMMKSKTKLLSLNLAGLGTVSLFSDLLMKVD